MADVPWCCNHPGRRTELDAFPFLNVGAVTQFGIDAFGHGHPGGADMSQKADRAQQPRGVVDQMEERSERGNTEQGRQ